MTKWKNAIAGTTDRKVCKPAPFEEDTDLPMTFERSHPIRPRRPLHDGSLKWLTLVACLVKLMLGMSSLHCVWQLGTSIMSTTLPGVNLELSHWQVKSSPGLMTFAPRGQLNWTWLSLSPSRLSRQDRLAWDGMDTLCTWLLNSNDLNFGWQLLRQLCLKDSVRRDLCKAPFPHLLPLTYTPWLTFWR